MASNESAQLTDKEKHHGNENYAIRMHVLWRLRAGASQSGYANVDGYYQRRSQYAEINSNASYQQDHYVSLSSTLRGQNPVLLAGTHAEVDQALAGAGLPARPASLAGKGTAQVWTVPGQPYPLAIISAHDAATLSALQRALPHYGGQSWLVFEQGRVIDKGIWPAGIPEITVATTPEKDKK